MLARLQQWEAMLHVYYPVWVRHCVRHNAFLDEHAKYLLNAQYKAWYEDHHEVVRKLAEQYCGKEQAT